MSSGTPFPWKSLFLLLPLSILISGYNLYFSNQDIQIPLVMWLNDPSLFPGDPFVATLGGYSSLLWPSWPPSAEPSPGRLSSSPASS